ncbi:hypothetical protein BDY21DRAFT_293683 [Lineolata rhizophorae]|uniref:ubiquitinyl hydrolase 1 n=1 Tax=Lineolata rhizophorae TaxID=578093 RepID=A0A6A6NMZ7_9PEZI|nr:hypothetical protein BDY21DRAFT_293683 [Lineolata rhizophorae]
MFKREYRVIDSAASAKQLRLRLKDAELEQYGDSFVPQYVYDVIQRLPRFSTMRRGHQQDAEEFLGFLLAGLHDECIEVMNKLQVAAVPDGSDVTSVASDQSSRAGVDAGWLEVGPKQKAAVTRQSGTNLESPITKIFGGKLRSVLRVPGLKDSVTLEQYQPLQLDIGAPEVHSITDALRHLTIPETLQGSFNSPRGANVRAKKQVFIETLPPVLILHLKRFQYDERGGTQKIWKRVGYPLELEIPRDVFPLHKRGAMALSSGSATTTTTTTVAAPGPPGAPATSSPLPHYRLSTVVYHHGRSAQGGHYTADVRRQDGREWIRLDDTALRRVRAADVAAAAAPATGAPEDDAGAGRQPGRLAAAAAAADRHRRDASASAARSGSRNVFEVAGLGGEDGDGVGVGMDNGADGANAGGDGAAAAGGGWKEVNGGAVSPGSAGKGSPREGDVGDAAGVRDGKVAYILFYERI